LGAICFGHHMCARRLGGLDVISETISATIEKLLKLPAADRVEIAMALWESLEDPDREDQFELTAELEAELDRRWEEHLADPGSAIPWEVVEHELKNRARA